MSLYSVWRLFFEADRIVHEQLAFVVLGFFVWKHFQDAKIRAAAAAAATSATKSSIPKTLPEPTSVKASSQPARPSSEGVEETTAQRSVNSSSREPQSTPSVTLSAGQPKSSAVVDQACQKGKVSTESNSKKSITAKTASISASERPSLPPEVQAKLAKMTPEMRAKYEQKYLAAVATKKGSLAVSGDKIRDDKFVKVVKDHTAEPKEVRVSEPSVKAQEDGDIKQKQEEAAKALVAPSELTKGSVRKPSNQASEIPSGTLKRKQSSVMSVPDTSNQSEVITAPLDVPINFNKLQSSKSPKPTVAVQPHAASSEITNAYPTSAPDIELVAVEREEAEESARKASEKAKAARREERLRLAEAKSKQPKGTTGDRECPPIFPDPLEKGVSGS